MHGHGIGPHRACSHSCRRLGKSSPARTCCKNLSTRKVHLAFLDRHFYLDRGNQFIQLIFYRLLLAPYPLRIRANRIVFSAGQLFQIAAILLAPVVIRKFGEAGGIAAMQVATALMLALLALGPIQIASVAYIGYVSFQYMSEPGLFSLLMNRVSPGEQRAPRA